MVLDEETVYPAWIPVTWDSEPEYDGDTEGRYVFTADTGGYVLADSAKLPGITVTVKKILKFFRRMTAPPGSSPVLWMEAG